MRIKHVVPTYHLPTDEDYKRLVNLVIDHYDRERDEWYDWAKARTALFESTDLSVEQAGTIVTLMGWTMEMRWPVQSDGR